MKYLSHNDIRKIWFNYFTSKGHKIEESASLVPVDDDSLLWVNAGVTPLKKYFDGTKVPDNKRLCSIQKCIRTNDIDNVGVTKRHQTFFEMMGNFSIGDYFKDEAIEYSFELLTSEKYFGIDKDLLYVTIYSDDDDAKEKWIEVGLDPDHIIPLEGNFWEIGEGPCGPDSEIFFDRGEDFDKDHDALNKLKNDEDQERYVEIWNNVFSQFNSESGVDRKDYKELPSKNIDTGAGLERWCSIFQGVESNFETDLFIPIIKHIEELSSFQYVGQKEFKVIADHIRAITFALADGASFENVGRGYVLRRLLRRSVRFGKNIGIECPFMYKIVSDVIDVMKDAYPYLTLLRPKIEVDVLEEEKLFLKTLEAGERRLKELVLNSKDGFISGEDVFKLYDTYGFPFELTEEYLLEKGFKTSYEDFKKYMDIQKETAKKNAKTKSSMASQKKVLLDFKDFSEFVYGIYRQKSKIIAIFAKDELITSSDHDTYLAVERTCFYAESGGQVSDTGMIIGKNFTARVVDVFKGPNGQHIHKVRLLDGVISVGDEVELIIDKERRKKIECNHSSVHILQYSLQQVVSSSIKQAGSYVDEDKLRFDFTYSGKMNDEKLLEVEKYVNDYISEGYIVSTEIMPIDKAKKLGAMALFSEKYGDVVRVVKIGKSIELCGGTHTTNTKEIKKLAIILCESKGSNVYRIEAVTDQKIEDALLEIIKPINDEMIKILMKAKTIIEEAKELGIFLDFDYSISNNKPTSYKDIILAKGEVKYLQQEYKSLEKKYNDLKEKNALQNLDIYKEKIKAINGIETIITKVDNKDVEVLKSIVDNLINEMNNGFVFIFNECKDSTTLIAKSSSKVHAGNMMKKIVSISNGRGGGSPSFAQGAFVSYKDIDNLIKTIEKDISNV